MDLLIDGTNIQIRSFSISLKFGKKDSENLSNLELSGGGIYIFLRTLRNLKKILKPDRIWICWDKKLIWPSTNFRKKAHTEYKGNRERSNENIIFANEDDLIRMVSFLGCKNLFPRVLEADDVISWLTKKLNQDIVIASTDKDFLQLISTNIKFYDLISKSIISLENFENLFNISQKNYLLYKAIIGDKSDNIPKLKGIGPKKGIKIASNWDHESKLLSNEQLEQINHNLELINLDDSWKKEKDEEEFYEEQYNNLEDLKDFNKFQEYIIKYNLQSILKEISTWQKDFEGLK